MKPNNNALAIFAGVLFLASSSSGQIFSPVAPNPVNPNQPTPLDGYLLRWEQEMARIQSLVADLRLIEKDKTFDATTISIGGAKYMKAGPSNQPVCLASLDLRKQSKTEVERKFLCTGNFLYELNYEQKVVRAFEMPKPKPGQVADDSFLTFLFGLKAEEAKRRYGMKLFKEDSYYAYIDVVPRFPADRADFQRARLVLNRGTFLPRELWFEKPNGDEITWDIPKIDTLKPVDRKDFDPPQLGKDWRVMNTSAPSAPNVPIPGSLQPPPRVVRPSP